MGLEVGVGIFFSREPLIFDPRMTRSAAAGTCAGCSSEAGNEGRLYKGPLTRVRYLVVFPVEVSLGQFERRPTTEERKLSDINASERDESTRS